MEDVAGLIDASGARETVLIAHDWGAVIAWYFAIRQIRPLDAKIRKWSFKPEPENHEDRQATPLEHHGDLVLAPPCLRTPVPITMVLAPLRLLMPAPITMAITTLPNRLNTPHHQHQFKP